MASSRNRVLEAAMATPLSDTDIRHVLGSSIGIITYQELEDVKDLDEIFDDQGRCMLLYLISGPTSGHWVCLQRTPEGVEFFDAIGSKQGGGRPDSQLAWVPAHKRADLGEDSPRLMRLIREKGVPLVYNKVKLQDKDRAIATCGRHCCVRLLKRALLLDDYVDAITSIKNVSPDEFVTEATFQILHK